MIYTFWFKNNDTQVPSGHQLFSNDSTSVYVGLSTNSNWISSTPYELYIRAELTDRNSSSSSYKYLGRGYQNFTITILDPCGLETVAFGVLPTISYQLLTP